MSESFENYKYTHLPASEHLRRAKLACADPTGGWKTCRDMAEAEKELNAVSSSAPEYKSASESLAMINLQRQLNEAEWNVRRSKMQTDAYERYQMNMSGNVHDAFVCATSTTDTTIVSFDSGQNWWADDGRCADKMQAARDAEAKAASYTSSTIRVDTNIDSTWLRDEERTCQSYPDAKGKVSGVLCPGSESKLSHSLPIKFWGGLNRNTVSSWKCRREASLFDDSFVCRAID